MSSALVTDADYKFFDFLSPYRWPTATKTQIKLYRELVADGDLSNDEARRAGEMILRDNARNLYGFPSGANA
jgi:hypothetical protein